MKQSQTFIFSQCRNTLGGGIGRSLKKLVHLLTVCAMVCSIITTPVRAEENIVINIAYAGSEDSTYGIFTSLFKKYAEEMVDGITIKPRCCASLITEDEAFKALQLGTVDMSIITGNNISPHYPLWDAFVLPYIFYNRDHGYRVLDGSVGTKFRDKFEKTTNVHILSWGNIVYRDFYNTVRPINSMADMAGIKIRVPKNEVMLDTFQAFGASPIPLPWSETPPALQTGTVQGGDNGTTFIKTMKFYEIAKNLAILEHFAAFAPLFASDRVMKKLSPAQQEGLRQAMRKTDLEYRQVMVKQIEDVHKFLANEGKMKVTYPRRDEFVAASQKLQDEWLANKGPEFRVLVEEIRNTQ